MPFRKIGKIIATRKSTKMVRYNTIPRVRTCFEIKLTRLGIEF